MTDYVTGCTHFGHANIIRLAGRPFACVEEMDEAMIERWNETVKPGDTVYHLGDFSMQGRHTARVEPLLNGRLVRIRGNHDKESWGQPYLEIESCGERIVLCHYPFEEWNGWFRGSLHFHAHTHAKNFVTAERRGYAGVDACDFRPLAMEEAIARLKA